ncbi:uncharacterized protein BO80DRAFT_427683 [Aspergillus ibericus CBS 121593]|uniref:Uncharacterized protein n=1 Tax=Aspergillus ibericus CBS 121593 TaxID=1448316 RepID=A0A395GRK7_9EURO|nr:hypothetical protein BO80DRAFT_427683 [Aspergillus ibericus CBS 121593]RAK98002.1 hypothetical protein BO80DRAFT_427683 [Aspergillus ibericus CBS 121593]
MPPSPNSQSPVTESSSSSPPTRTLRSVRGERVSRATMPPLPPTPPPHLEEPLIIPPPPSPADPEEKSHEDEDWISVPLEEKHPTQQEISLPAQSTSGKVLTSALYSRLPTPVNPPTSDLYSHEVYQQEGRRSVLSSLGRRFAGIRRQEKGEACAEGTCTISSQQHQRDRMRDESKPSEQKTTGLPAPLRTNKGRDSERVSLRRANVLPTTSTTSISRTHDSSNSRRSLPVMVAGRPSTQIYSRKETAPDRPVKQARPSPSSSPTCAIATDEHSPHSEQERDASKDCQPHARHPPQMPSGKVPPKRIRWTSKFEDLRAEGPDKEAKDTREAATIPPEDKEGEKSLTPRTKPNADADLVPETRLRHRERTERMVSSPRGQPSHPPPPPPPLPPSSSFSRIPSAVSRRKPTLTVHTSGLSQVKEAQPREYWLGRFMTLTNAFHYEDSFQEPDVATGFGMLSSYSRPLGGSDGDLANYRVKRAFMVLENVCVTDEAGASLRAFRDEYVRLYGDRWMD